MVTVRLGYVRSDGTPVLLVSWWWSDVPKFFVTMPAFQMWSRINPSYMRRNLVVRYGSW